MTDFYLVRHGVTTHTGHRITGWLPGVSLSDDGRTEAEAAAETLAAVPLKAVFSSPIDRTLETAKIIAGRHRIEVTVSEALGEVRYGRWTNRSIKALARTKLWNQVQRWPSGVRFPEGESLREVQERGVGEVERIRSLYPRSPVCCVSHADTIRLIAAHYLGVHIDLFHRIVIGPASITVVSVGQEGPRVLAVNLPPRLSLSKR
jgi:probable phosphomutase (TIGR03848 family)